MASNIFQRIRKASSNHLLLVPDDNLACHSRRSRAQPSSTCETRMSFHTSSIPLPANGHVEVLDSGPLLRTSPVMDMRGLSYNRSARLDAWESILPWT